MQTVMIKNPLFTGPNYLHISIQAQENLSKIVKDSAHLNHASFVDLKKMLDGPTQFTKLEQSNISDALVKVNHDPIWEVMRNKKTAAMVRSVSTCIGRLLLTFLAIVALAGVFVVSGVNGLILSTPVWMGAGGRAAFKSTWAVFGSITAGFVLMCVLYRFVFKDAFQLLWSIVYPILQCFWRSVMMFIGDAIDLVKKVFFSAIGWASSQLSQSCKFSSCDMSKFFEELGGMANAKTLALTLATALLALNQTHVLMDNAGNRVDILPKDFPSLPSIPDQHLRIVNRVPVQGEEVKMEMPKNKFQEQAEFLKNQENKKASHEKKDDSWAAYVYGWAAWGGRVACEHAAVYAVLAVTTRMFKGYLNGRSAQALMPVVKTVVTAFVGYGTSQIVENESYSVVASMTGAAMFCAWKLAEYAMGMGLDYVLKTNSASAAAPVEVSNAGPVPPGPIDNARAAAEKRAAEATAGPAQSGAKA